MPAAVLPSALTPHPPVYFPRLETQARSDNNITDWQEAVSVEEVLSPFRNDLLDVLRPFQTMWNEHLGHVKSTSHRIELQQDARPVFQTPSHAVPAQRKTEQSHKRTMFNQPVMEPATSDWGSPIVLMSKK